MRCLSILRSTGAFLPAAILAVGLFLIPLSNPAHAVGVLSYDDTANGLDCDANGAGCVVSITDNGAGDIQALAGVLTSVSSTTDWTVIVDTGLSYPFLGSTSDPHMDLNYIVANNTVSTIVTYWSDFDFIELDGIADLTVLAGGTVPTGGTVTLNVFVDLNNTGDLYAAGQEGNLAALNAGVILIDSFSDPGGAYAFTGGGTAIVGVNDTYSIHFELIIAHTLINSSSGNIELLSIPEPATLGLFGIGLAGLGIIARRRRKKLVV